jgi:AhpD family alkylhydroperoxidase
LFHESLKGIGALALLNLAGAGHRIKRRGTRRFPLFPLTEVSIPMADLYPGALPAKTKQLIAVAVAHVTQCPYCIRGHTKAALRHGATREELMEAIWVSAEMRAGGAYAHSALAIATMDEVSRQQPGTQA